MNAKLIRWRADSMAVLVEDPHGRRLWCEVTWNGSQAVFVHLCTRYSVPECGTELTVIELLPRPGDGSDQPTLF